MAGIISGVCWTIAYLSLIYRGFKDKTCGMPLVALSLNFSWETVFSFIYKTEDTALNIVNPIWFILDLIILITYIMYSYKYLNHAYGISKLSWIFISLCAFLTSFAIMILGKSFFISLDYFNGSIYEVAIFIAYIQNAIMSILFVNMFYTRKKSGYSIQGQSFYVALPKFIGSSLSVGISYIILHQHNWSFVGIFIILIFIFDLWYCFLIWKELRDNNINPFKRF